MRAVRTWLLVAFLGQAWAAALPEPRVTPADLLERVLELAYQFSGVYISPQSVLNPVMWAKLFYSIMPSRYNAYYYLLHHYYIKHAFHLCAGTDLWS
jgi:hypothetical protein